MYAEKCHREQTAEPRSANLATYMQVEKECLPILIKIVNVIDIHFQVQIFESITLRSSYVIISHMMTDMSDSATGNIHKVA